MRGVLVERADKPRRRRDAEEGAERTEPLPELNYVTGEIVDGAISVHRALGPGLLESVYERCLAYELKNRGFDIVLQAPASIKYKELIIEGGFRMDMVVNNRVVVEIKSVERLLPLHEAQLLTYLKITGVQVGLLINFNTMQLKDGLRRLVNSTPSASLRLRG
jgi:GxxExxY protein